MTTAALDVKNGGFHLAPIWYAVDDGDLLFMTSGTSLKGRTLLRDPRAALCVDDEIRRPPLPSSGGGRDLRRTWTPCGSGRR